MATRLNLSELLAEPTFSASDLRDALAKPHRDAVAEAQARLFNLIRKAATNGQKAINGVHSESDKVFWEALHDMRTGYGFTIAQRGWNHGTQEAGWTISW